MGRFVGHIDKADYQKKLKPLFKMIGFKYINYNNFEKDYYHVNFQRDRYNGSRIYGFCIKDKHTFKSLYFGSDVNKFIKCIKNEMNSYIRKYKIQKLLE